MKSKIAKLITVLLLLITLTMINFIYVGIGIVSLAAENTVTSHKNIEYTAEIKNENLLTLTVNVKNEGYFNGEIILNDSNFIFKRVVNNSEYINKIEENRIILNQINAGSMANIDIEIEPIKDENLDVSLLDVECEVELSGNYKDSTEKDIKISAKRNVKLEYVENNNEDNIQDSIKLITNKIVKVNNEEKRVYQISVNMGLKENNYPIKEINTNIILPETEEIPSILTMANLNNMTNYEYKLEEKNINLHLTNNPNEENKVLWKQSGCENIIITLIYNKDVNLEGNKLPVEEVVKLYNNKEIKVSNTLEITNEEKDSLIQVVNNPIEEVIYKGKINASLDRSFEAKTDLIVNLANCEDNILIKENASLYSLNNGTTIEANVVYNKTTISKEDFNKVLGQNGSITILNMDGTILGILNSSTNADENGNIVFDYSGKEPSSLEIRTSKPIAEGKLTFKHMKTIKSGEEEKIKEANEIITNVTANYNTGADTSSQSTIKLEVAKTEATLGVDRDTLSTAVQNNLEIRATLKTNNEQNNLYENPKIIVELPEPIENIEINSIDLVYELELKISNYYVEGRKIIVELTGKQTSYKDTSIDGAILIINALVNVDRKAVTQDGKLIMNIKNKAENITVENPIKVVAPTDMTVINNINDLGIETIGQEETKVVSIARGAEAKDIQTQIEVINNNENAMENVKILGTFPTRNSENNIDSTIVQGISIQGVEKAKIYYTENENATDDLQNPENEWKDNISDTAKVKMYLIDIPTMETGTDVVATYTTNIPASLEYNQVAKQHYKVNYQNTLTKLTSEVVATEINMETGIGPILETKLTTSISDKDVQNGDIVKNGEVIKYRIETSNIGSVDITNIQVKGKVPEGTKLVIPKENFEYTGASYYDELEDEVYEDTIDSLAVGETVTKEYEVRVSNDTKIGTNLVNKSSVTYGDVTKESEESSLVTGSGDIRVTVKRVTDRDVDLYESGNIQYFAIIENISNETQEDVKVKTNLPTTLEVSRLNLITGMSSEDVSDEDLLEMTSGSGNNSETAQPIEVTEEELAQNNVNVPTTEQIEYKDELNIGSIEPGQNKVLSYDLKINKLDGIQGIEFSVKASVGENDYNSNVITDEVRKIDISLSMATEPDKSYVKVGDTIKYIIKVKNNGTQDINDLVLKDEIPSSLSVNKITLNEGELADLEGKNNIEIRLNMTSKAESIIEIETIVNYSEGRTEAEAVTNVAYAEVLAETVAKTPEVTHIIEANEVQTGNDENNDESTNNVANGKGTITGIAWFDENANGKKDVGEKLISGVKVRLFNTENNSIVKNQNGNELEVTTNENGVYVLDHIQKGTYIVIFDYANSAYGLTKYKAEGVDEANNSDAIMKELSIDGQSKDFASTDIITVEDGNISDINVGYIKLQKFDLQLEKYVTKIVIQDSSGSTIKEYDNETLARAELDAKKVNGTTVLIEYTIKISNVGEANGYVRRIVDYKPSGLKFNSEMNKDWYQTTNGIYNESLANDEIKAGETRQLKLILTRDMTENNLGLINNTAEIDECYNDLGLADSNSTPGNRVNGENDMGSADIILGIRTGGVIYIWGTILAVVILGTVSLVVIKKSKNSKKKI